MFIYALPALAYLLGSVSTGVVVARVLGLQDPRETGSKNPGATNLLRYGGKLAAVLTLLGDIFKGVVAVLVARAFTDDAAILALTGLAAFIGHLWPVFFGFHGGKGVATALGVWLALNPGVGLLLIGTWLATAAVFRYSSLAALMAAAVAPLYVAWRMPQPAYIVMMAIMSALLVFRHRANIARLLAGTETKIGK
ncbi:MAG: glycerol-3-phosphate acyltransferase [Candidatus Muproteobacteria bacterium RBG_16_64_10]|uniref:Glycerol-3-phosphate acyltransferase n=1 Tax=Candidatus Muproteobacteria bacterium RBG_16_64_10 TaxID=1817757 RepID=A0A1F6T3H6_9PROT|nr:MAG: glycerol-3-phosphate acyltransferase [Candidatus Muproteobacteria bacterium RBG_16_64_10]